MEDGTICCPTLENDLDRQNCFSVKIWKLGLRGIKLQESNNLHGKMLYLVLKIGY
jgi:hypothetical protein